MNPKVMLFVRPTSELDPKMSAVLDTMPVDLAGRGMTMLRAHEMDCPGKSPTAACSWMPGQIIERNTPQEFFAIRSTEDELFLSQILR